MWIWRQLCVLAIKRHRLLWSLMGGNPITWPWHVAQIVKVYGPETYTAALRQMTRSI